MLGVHILQPENCLHSIDRLQQLQNETQIYMDIYKIRSKNMLFNPQNVAV